MPASNRYKLLLFTLVVTTPPAWAGPFGIQVIDAATSRAIPQVILETSLSTRHVTDSNGLVAYDDPLGMNRSVFFKPVTDGYTYKSGPLAMGGITLEPVEGGEATILMHRDMIAERLYRITGAGIYRDSEKLGFPIPIKEPMLNAGVSGQDSALCAVFNKRLFWIWGDTSSLRHPLAANFRATAAFSDLPPDSDLSISRGIDLEYIGQDGFTKSMMPLRPGKGAQVYWLSCLMTVPDNTGREHLLAWWSRVDGPGMETIERGIAEFAPEKNEFVNLTDHPTTAPVQPGGHAVKHGDHMIFTDYGKQTRVPATYEAAKDPAKYEALTCLEGTGEFTTATARVTRSPAQKVVYQWRADAAPTGPAEQRALVEAGLLKPEECLYRPADNATGKTFVPHSCSMAYYPSIKKWINLTSELMGSSMLGEVWYMEADSPTGPWQNAVKVLTHSQYSFYNPLQHPELIEANEQGKYLYFEGTYTKTFSPVQTATPYYDYNQVMYRVNLQDERLGKIKRPAFTGELP